MPLLLLSRQIIKPSPNNGSNEHVFLTCAGSSTQSCGILPPISYYAKVSSYSPILLASSEERLLYISPLHLLNIGRALDILHYASTSIFYTDTSLYICSFTTTMYSNTIFGGLNALVTILAMSQLAAAAPVQSQDSDVHINDPRMYITPPRDHTNEPRMYIPPSDDHINEPRMHIPPSDDYINEPRMHIPASNDHINEPRMHIPASNDHLNEPRMHITGPPRVHINDPRGEKDPYGCSDSQKTAIRQLLADDSNVESLSAAAIGTLLY